MKWAILGAVGFLVVWSGAASCSTYTTPILDSDYGVGEWGAEAAFGQVTISNADYELHMTWDEDFYYVCLDRLAQDDDNRLLCDEDSCLSLFVAIDTNQVYGSGATSDAYGNVNFGGDYMPEYVFYFAGMMGWHGYTSWNGSAWDWHDWRPEGAYYGWFGDGGSHLDDEMRIPWGDIGSPAGMAVMAAG